MSKDDQMVIPGRMFHVEMAEERMEFGSDRIGDPGKDRPALMLRHWRDATWLALPSSWRQPAMPGKFPIRPQDWVEYLRPGAPPEEYVSYWYERVVSDWLYNPLGDVKSARFDDVTRWVKAWHSTYPARLKELDCDGSMAT